VNLNESQNQAISYLDGPLMVLAGPGSGKTTVITHRALRLAKKPKIVPQQILIITFSKAAATEMEHRFKLLSGGLNCTFGTFHAVFFRVLRNRYKYSLENVFYENERRNIVKKLLIDFQIEPDDDLLLSVLSEISLVKNEMHDLTAYNSKIVAADQFKELFFEYEKIKRQHNKIDFDDMLTLCHNLWQTEPDCLAFWQSQFKYIMIDEFQDINQVQYECIRMLSAKPHHLCIVGDDDQSIYRFRGSRPEFLLKFPEDYPQTKRILLDVNYRSTDNIIEFSNKVIEKNQNRYDKVIVGTQKNGPNPQILHNDDQNSEAKFIALQIRKMLDETLEKNLQANLNEIAIIYRTNMQSRAFVDAFMLANIPFVSKDEISVVYSHWMVRDIFAYLRLAHKIGTAEDVERIINKPFRFIGKPFIQKMRQDKLDIFSNYAKSPMLNVRQKSAIEELVTDIKALRKYKTLNAIKFIRNKIGYDAHIKNHCEYQKINPIGLYEILNEIQEAAAEFPKFADFMQHAEEAIQNKNLQEPANPDDNRVTLTTMHSAKGLEFDIVYLVGAVEGLIPHERSKTPAEIEEERRLFYVGATRARNDLYISVIKKRHEKEVEPTRFLGKTVYSKNCKTVGLCPPPAGGQVTR